MLFPIVDRLSIIVKIKQDLIVHSHEKKEYSVYED